MLQQGEAEGVEGLALIDLAAHAAQGPRARTEAAEPVEEEGLPAQGLALVAQQGERRVQQPLVRRLAQALDPQPVQEGRAQMADIGWAEPVQRLGQGRDPVLGDQLQTAGQLGQVPEHRLRLAREGVEAGVVEIGGGEGRVVVGQEPPRPVVEALARHVQIVGVQHPMDETGGDPPGRQPRRGLDHGGQEAGRVAGRDRGVIQAAGVLQQDFQLVLAAEVGGALEGPEADVAVRQPHHDRRAGRRRLVVALQRLAGLDQRQDAAGRNPQAFQHGGGQDLAHPALQRQPPVPAPRPRRLAGAFRSEVEKSIVLVFPIASLAEGGCLRGLVVPIALLAEQGCLRGFSQLRRQEAAPVADVRVVGAELVAVIAHGDGAGLTGQGPEAAEMAQPFLLAQRVQPDAGRRPVVADPQDGLGKVGRQHRIAELGAEVEEARIGAVGGRDGHAAADARSPPVSQLQHQGRFGLEPTGGLRIFNLRDQVPRRSACAGARLAPSFDARIRSGVRR